MKLNIKEIEEIIKKIEKYDKITDIIFLGENKANVRMSFHYDKEGDTKDE